MLENWLKPTKWDINNADEGFLGENINFFNGEIIEKSKIALISIDDKSSYVIKKNLYKYVKLFTSDYVTDLGVLRKKNEHFLINIIKEITAAGIIPIIIGEKENIISAQIKSYHERKKLPTVSIIDNKIRFGVDAAKKDYVNEVLTSAHREKGVFHLSHIASQSHLIDTNAWNSLEFMDYDLVRLGQLRPTMEMVEPIIRSADSVIFHIDAIRAADAPGQANGFPSGLTIEEACQLARYAGISDQLSSIGFYGYEPKNDVGERTAKGIAMMIWYFIDGVLNRKNDYPVSLEQMTEYLVEIKGFTEPMVFWKSNKSQRWWIQVFNTQSGQNHLLPCSYKDYLEACDGELPERIWNGIRRFS
jgi:formiminoglutamase